MYTCLQVRHAHAAHLEHQLNVQLPSVPCVTKAESPWPAGNHQNNKAADIITNLPNHLPTLLLEQTSSQGPKQHPYRTAIAHAN